MSLRLRWLVSHSASSLHIAAALARGQTLIDDDLAEAMAEPVAEMRRDILAAQLPEARYWRMLCALATTFENNRQLAKLAAFRTLGASPPAELGERIGGRISDLEAVVARLRPNLIEELTLRAGPLREQWEARGPGMLSRLFSLTEAKLMVDAADIVLVLPVLGGGGEAQIYNNSARIEAVLTHPHSRLPETVRLGWMLSQLHLDLPMYAEDMHVDRVPNIAALAMLPPALAAAEYVELIELSEETLALALDAWQIRVPVAVDAVDVLLRWWDAYQEAKPPFEVALKALDQMVA